MKYNVTNCPAFDKNQYECISQDTDRLCCWMNEDCILKHIVKVCEEYKNNYCINNGVHLLIGEILNLLEIEEVNE